MQLQELKEQAFKLPPSERLALVSAIIESLQNTPIAKPERSESIQRMRGLLKTGDPSPTDQQIAEMLEERRMEKYL